MSGAPPSQGTRRSTISTSNPSAAAAGPSSSAKGKKRASTGGSGGSSSSSRSAKTLGMRLLASVLGLEDHDGKRLADPFLALPDAKRNPRYYETITHPICFNDIRAALEVDDSDPTFEFRNLEDVKETIDEVLMNAQRWNQAGSRLHTDATRLKMYCRDRCEIVQNTLDDGGDGPAPAARVLARPVVPRRHFDCGGWQPIASTSARARSKGPSSYELEVVLDAPEPKRQRVAAAVRSSVSRERQASPSQVFDLEREIQQQAQELRALKKDLDRFRDVETGKEAAEKKALQVEKSLKNAKKKIEDLETERSAAAQKLSSAKSKLGKVNAEKVQLQNRVTGVELEMNLAETNNDRLEERITTLTADLAAVRAERDQALVDRTEQNGINRLVCQERDSLRTRLHAAQLQVQEDTQTIAALEQARNDLMQQAERRFYRAPPSPSPRPNAPFAAEQHDNDDEDVKPILPPNPSPPPENAGPTIASLTAEIEALLPNWEQLHWTLEDLDELAEGEHGEQGERWREEVRKAKRLLRGMTALRERVVGGGRG